MFSTQSLVHWPTGQSYPGETFRVVRVRGQRDVTIMDRQGFTATVHPLCLEAANA